MSGSGILGVNYEQIRKNSGGFFNELPAEQIVKELRFSKLAHWVCCRVFFRTISNLPSDQIEIRVVSKL